VRSDGVDDVLRLVVLAQQIRADLGVRPLYLVVDRLAEVVEEADPLRLLFVEPELRRDHAHEISGLERVLQHVLRKAVTVFQAAEQLHDLRRNALDAGLEHGGFADLVKLFLELLADLLGQLLDTGRVDASVADEPLHELPRNLLAHRVEATDDHRLGRIVDEDADAGRRLDRADVASLTADDPPLHLVARQRDGRRGALIRAVARIALNRVGQNAARLALALRLRFLEQIPDHDAGFILDFVLELLKQDSARLFTPELGDAFEFVDLLRNTL